MNEFKQILFMCMVTVIVTIFRCLWSIAEDFLKDVNFFTQFSVVLFNDFMKLVQMLLHINNRGYNVRVDNVDNVG